MTDQKSTSPRMYVVHHKDHPPCLFPGDDQHEAAHAAKLERGDDYHVTMYSILGSRIPPADLHRTVTAAELVTDLERFERTEQLGFTEASGRRLLAIARGLVTEFELRFAALDATVAEAAEERQGLVVDLDKAVLARADMEHAFDDARVGLLALGVAPEKVEIYMGAGASVDAAPTGSPVAIVHSHLSGLVDVLGAHPQEDRPANARQVAALESIAASLQVLTSTRVSRQLALAAGLAAAAQIADAAEETATTEDKPDE